MIQKGRLLPTPSHHRTQFVSIPQTGNGLSNGTFSGPNRVQQTPQRQPLANVGTGSINRPIISGYGMSAGLRVGRQQGKRVSIAI